MLKINDRVRYLGPDAPELGISSGMEGIVVSVNVPDDVYTDDEDGDRARFYATVATVNFTFVHRTVSNGVPSVWMGSVHAMQNSAADADPAFGDVPQSTGIGVYARQLQRITK